MDTTASPSYISEALAAEAGSSWQIYMLAIMAIAVVFSVCMEQVRSIAIFAYNCFVRPLGKHASQQTRLNAFYKSQAGIYDATRKRLLRGRCTMLKLCAAELRKVGINNKKLIWVDIGGGTGWNIEQMDKYYKLSNFHRIYLVDLCQPLCKVAEQRFKAKGWSNIHVVCQDAASFKLPDSETTQEADLVTMSYSLSMIDNFYAAVDTISKLLVPVTGILGVADFYVSDSCAASTIYSMPGYHCNWFTRMFWLHWFELDHVYLHPSRRNYLEHAFSPVKAFNGRNHFVIPYLVQIPYYVWIGKRQSAQPLTDSSKQSGWTRLPYNPAKPEHTQFSTYIYGFTWEDPQADIAALDLQSGDNIMVITSAGDNALAYAAHTNGLTIHCVDMNPCQNHLLELKLAALSTLDYSQFWSMFGVGRLPNFKKVLDTELSAELSLPAYQYWRSHLDTFTSNTSNSLLASLMSLGRHNLYTTGYSGLALRCLAVVTKLLGVSKDLKQISGASSLTDQIKIWCSRVSHNLLSSTSIHILDNPLAIWRLMGVPSNQLKMLHDEGSMSQYVRDTLDPVFLSTHISSNNYFYRMLICQQYSQTCCPDYLTKPVFGKLQEIARNTQDTTFNIHTATIVDTLQKMKPGELSKAVIMDHMDWCTPDEADAEIDALKTALKQGGFVLWRSAARIPWYVANFKASGFKVEAISVRQPNTQTALDRVNMYASFYKATKP